MYRVTISDGDEEGTVDFTNLELARKGTDALLAAGIHAELDETDRPDLPPSGG